MNNVTLIGRICNDIEMKTTTNGVEVINFCLAVNRKFKNANGEKQTDFINIVAWRKTAEFIYKYFSKGQQIAITGNIQTRNYEDKQGNKRTAFEVIADNVYFCGSKSDKPNINVKVEENTSSGYNAKIYTGNEQANVRLLDGDEELPF